MLKVGDSVDRYVIEAVIGEGGMGRVYRALDPRLGRRVALKVLLAEGNERVRSDAAARMLREARAAAAFNHPNVVASSAVGEVDGSPYIAMELFSGHTLRTAGARDAVSDVKKVSWLSDVARGLAAAHRSGLVHRDIKPDNVMITTDGVVKILDFGIARRADTGSTDVDIDAPTAAANLPSITAEGHMIGTPQYMAPEQLRGEPVDRRCDEFSWGVMAWELLAGKSPWGAPTNPAVLVTAVLSTAAPPLRDILPEIPPTLSDVVERALSKDRDARFPTMDDLLTVLDGSSPKPTSTPRPHEAPLLSAARMPAKWDAPIANANTAPALPPSDQMSLSTMQAVSAGTGAEPARPRRDRRQLFVIVGLVTLIAGGAGIVRAVTYRAHEGSGATPRPGASSSPRGSPVVAVAGPEENLFPCRDTRRPLVPPPQDEVCVDGLVGWCATDGTQIGCCAEGMVARTRDGTCECPPGGVGSDSPLSKCPRATVTLKSDGAARSDGDSSRLGRLPPETIQGVVRANFGRLRLCYEIALKRNPDEKGRLKVRFEIGPTGRVFFARIQDTTLTDPEAQACMLEGFRSLQFPPPVGGVVTVVYPIVFEPGD